MDHVDSIIDLSLTHKVGVWESRTGTCYVSANSVAKYHLCARWASSQGSDGLSYAEGESDGDSNSRGVADSNIFSGVKWRCVSVAVVHQSIVSLVNPLPKDCVKRRRCSHKHAERNRKLDGNKRAHTHGPGYELTSIRIDWNINEDLRVSNVLNFLFCAQDMRLAVFFSRFGLFLLYSLEQLLHIFDVTVAFED